MAAPKVTVRQAGRLQLAIFDFVSAGDELPEHMHDETSNHITFIARGDFKVIGEAAIAGKYLFMGDVVDWPAGQRHGFVAMTHGARMVQVLK